MSSIMVMGWMDGQATLLLAPRARRRFELAVLLLAYAVLLAAYATTTAHAAAARWHAALPHAARLCRRFALRLRALTWQRLTLPLRTALPLHFCTRAHARFACSICRHIITLPHAYVTNVTLNICRIWRAHYCVIDVRSRSFRLRSLLCSLWNGRGDGWRDVVMISGQCVMGREEDGRREERRRREE